jgi:tellurite resistance protein
MEMHLMADWRRLAKHLALADGRIDTKETRIIKEALLGDGKLDKSEFEFLIEVRRAAESVVGEFDDLVFAAIKPVLLKDGSIDAGETKWLKNLLMSDGKIDEREKKFLQSLKEGGSGHAPEFLEWLSSLGL